MAQSFLKPEKSQLQRVNVSKIKAYRREYKINDIFENLKNFKRQAKEQEMLSNQGIEKSTSAHLKQSNTVSTSQQPYVNQKIKAPNATFV